MNISKKVNSPHLSAANDYQEHPKYRLALFAPLEPLRSGVATYTTKLIRGLLKKRPDVFIDAYIDDGYRPADFGSGRFRFLNHRLFPANRGLYDAVLYQTGNNFEFHGYMFPYIRKYGGTVELHDVKLHGIYAVLNDELLRSLKRLRLIKALSLLATYPELRFFLWHKFLKPLYVKERYLDTRQYRKSFLVRKARMIIVRDAQAVRHFRLPSGKCRIITHGIDIKPLPGESEKIKIRRRLKIKRDAFVLVSAGIINSIKKIDKVIEAMAAIGEQIPDALYVLAGESIRGDDFIETLIGRLGLERRVRITGWLSNEDWLDYITIADVGINLRSVNLGEHSGPTTNFFERGKVMLISDFEQNRIYPDEFAIKIPNSSDEVSVIADRIVWLHRHRGYLSRAGAKARRFAERELDFDEIIISQYCRALGLDGAKGADTSGG